jgi:hypothetical protein
MTKRCTICKVEKNTTEFGQNLNKRDGFQPYCIACSREKDRKCYHTNEDRKRKVRERKDNNYLNNRKLLLDFLREHPCVDCGESDPVVLEFDHVRGQKKFTVGSAVSFSLSVLMVEIEKCEIRCANCHRRRHAKENKWYNNLKEEVK